MSAGGERFYDDDDCYASVPPQHVRTLKCMDSEIAALKAERDRLTDLLGECAVTLEWSINYNVSSKSKEILSKPEIQAAMAKRRERKA